MASVTLSGCASTPAPVSDPPLTLLGERPDLAAMKSFQKLVQAQPGDADYERARIDYLLERLGKSPYTFVRNGMSYTNTRAAMHLKWKYLRFQKEAPTAEAFVDRIAAGSRMSGREYQMRDPYGRYYSLKNILHQELECLEEGLRVYHEERDREKARAEEIEKEIAAVKRQEAAVKSGVKEADSAAENKS